MTTSPKKITLSKALKNLSLRYNADLIFDSIDKSKEKEIVLDFSDINFMSRSFAQQYLLRKKKSSKKVIEKNAPQVVTKMFDVVKKQKTKSSFKAEDFTLIEVPPVHR